MSIQLMEAVLTKNTLNIPIFGPIWNFIVNVLGRLMDVIYISLDKIGWGNIGLAIIIFTFITKVILFPTALNQQKSSKLMGVIQPEIQAIQSKYKNKTDQASLVAQNAEIKAVYEKYGTSMAGGCLPLLLQMPIIFALYRIIYNIPAYVPSVKAVYENVSQALGGASAAQKLVDFANVNNWSKLLTGLHNLGLDDPAKYDSAAQNNLIIDFLSKLNPAQWSSLAQTFPNAAQVIQDAGTQSAHINNFLGLNLSYAPIEMGFTPNPYWLIPILAGLTQWFTTRLMPQNNMGGNEQSTQMMKSMNIMMPLMSVWFGFSFPSGLGLYWIASSVMIILQQLALNKYFGRMDTETFLKHNMDKVNAKRAKKGLPPIDEKSTQEKIKRMQEKYEKVEQNRMQVIAKQSAKTKESTDYYNRNAKPGSLASKANMVRLYNEKNEKKN